jgi:5-methyltetrahydropteroyltriglutamate--homocysteine methyltransferase
MAQRNSPPFRADHVGSFLRPKELLDAREQHQKGAISKSELRDVEDRAIREIVRFQEDLGLQGITDGEFRRTYFHIDFLEQIDGVETRGGISTSFHSATGEVNFAPPVMHVVAKLGHARPIQVADFQFLRSVTKRTPKVTIPSPTMLHFRGGRAAISSEVYPDLEAFYEDVAACYRAELKQLGDAGCTYVQLDDTNLAYLCDPKMRDGARKRGDDPNELPRRYARLINDLEVDGYFLEYDDARSGDFSPLRFVPKGKLVVLGLVTTKVGELESKDELKRRIDAAARYVPLDQLCLSPQCGFSSTVHGNEIARESQAAKLRLIVETAREVWGTS